ncbi:MAG: hypothetical protein HY738_23840 [Bacteroidia bacterium]|nr:hypothetical protein [Bacteroidia bacterium]
MRTIIFLLITPFFIISCNSSKKLIQKGYYDQAVKKAVIKLRKNPANQKEAINLDKAYKLANEQDNNRIKFLRQEGNPDIWDEVFQKYSALKTRQELVKTVLPITIEGKTINYQSVDYNREIIEAKKKAAEFFYVHGQKLLKQGDKLSAREAYSEFQKVKQYYRDYQDIDKFIEQAKYAGISRVFVNVANQSMLKITREFEALLLSIDFNRLNSDWVEYYTEKKNEKIYDYLITVQLTKIDLLPEKILEERYVDSKEIEDGWEYVLDNKGNVAKDSLGNDIKKPKKKTISCQVIKTRQTKVVHIEGFVEYFVNSTNKTLITIPVAADHVFDHVYAIANGDLKALTESSKKLIGIRPLPFPPDIDMIYNAGLTLQKSINDALGNNKYLIK